MAQSDDSREFGQDVWGAVGALNDAAIGFLDESARLAGHTSAGRAILAADIGYSVIFAGGDLTPWFPPAGIRARRLCCA